MKSCDRKQVLKVLGQLNEYQSRMYIAREALAYGRGGIKLMRKTTGMSRTTIIKGIKELKEEKEQNYLTKKITGRIRKEGGGRKKLEERYPNLENLLAEVVEENTSGDPMSLFK